MPTNSFCHYISHNNSIYSLCYFYPYTCTVLLYDLYLSRSRRWCITLIKFRNIGVVLVVEWRHLQAKFKQLYMGGIFKKKYSSIKGCRWMQGACVVKRFNSLTSNYKHSAPIDTSPLPDIHLIPLDTPHGQCFTDQFAVVLCPKIYNLSWKGRHIIEIYILIQ